MIEVEVTKNFNYLVENKDNRIVILEGSSRCFDGSQEVITINGNKQIKDINVNDYVLSYNELTKENEFRRVQGLHQFKNSKPCLKITLKNGTIIKCTEEHEFYFENKWVSINKLLKTDFVNKIKVIYYEQIEIEQVYDIAVEGNTNYYLSNGDDKILVHNSGKTYATLQYLIYYCLNNKNILITIAREELVVAKRTVLVDLIEILDNIKIPYFFNKSESIITINTNKIRIIGLDSKDKVLGLKQDIIYINEGLTIPIEIYLQLLQRTTKQMIVDYNPSYDKHFLYDWAEHREDCVLIKSTIFDNHLAPQEAIKQILSYEPTEKNIKQNTANEFYWRVYGLGERFKGEDVVIRKLYTYKTELEKSEIEWEIMGGDFGFAMDWTVLVKVTKQKNSNNIYCRVMLRDKGLTNQMIAQKINNNPLIDKNITQIWDSAEKKSVMELRLADVNAIPATKGAHSIYYGIQKLQNFNIYIYSDELSTYLYNGLIKLRFKMNHDGSMARDSKGYPILVDTGLDEVDALRYALEKFVNFN